MAGGYSSVPHGLLEEVGTAGFHVRIVLYLVIHRHANGSRQGCWCSMETLVRETGSSERTVRRGLRSLLASGWIAREARPGRTSIYRPITAPAAAPTPAIATPGSDATPVTGTPGSHATPAMAAGPPRPPGQEHPGHGSRTTPAMGAGQTRSQEQEPRNNNPGTRLSSQLSPSFLSPTGADGQRQRESGRREQPDRPRRRHSGEPAADPSLPLPLPPQLVPSAERIAGYWQTKAGSRSPQAFAALLEELLPVADAAGHQSVAQLLRQATQAGWPTINGSAWLSSHRDELAMAHHPAYREFIAT